MYDSLHIRPSFTVCLHLQVLVVALLLPAILETEDRNATTGNEQGTVVQVHRDFPFHT